MVYNNAAGIKRMMDCPVFHSQHFLSDMRFMPGIQVVQRTAHHKPDQLILVERIISGHVHAAHRGPIADNGDIIGNRSDLIKLMCNNDARYAMVIAQFPHKLKKVRRVLIIKRRSRFVKDQELDIFGQCFSDLYQLLLANADIHYQP